MAERTAILVIGPRWVGDMVMAQCLFSALHDLHPDSSIDVMAPAWAGPLVERMPEIRSRIDAPFERGKLQLWNRIRLGRELRGRYDQAYIMQGSWKSALVPFFAGIRLRVGHRREMRYGLVNRIVPLPVALKRKTALAFHGLAEGGTFRAPSLRVDLSSQRHLLDRHGLPRGGFVAMMPGAEFGPAKRWPSAGYAELARDLMARGMKVALFGSANDAPVTAEIAALAPGVVDLAGKTTLTEVIDLLAAARAAVSNDSGLMHVAAAVGTPIVGVYGSTSPENTPPLSERRELVWLGIECSPCHQKQCPLGHFACMNTLPSSHVLEAVDRLTA